jgi:hypothetical protein
LFFSSTIGISTLTLLLDGAASDASLVFAQRTKYNPTITRAEPSALENNQSMHIIFIVSFLLQMSKE